MSSNGDNRIENIRIEPVRHEPRQRGCGSFGFALVVIVALGAVLTGILAFNKVAYFKELGFIGAQIALYGGIGLGLIAIIIKVCVYCRGRELIQDGEDVNPPFLNQIPNIPNENHNVPHNPNGGQQVPVDHHNEAPQIPNEVPLIPDEGEEVHGDIHNEAPQIPIEIPQIPNEEQNQEIQGLNDDLLEPLSLAQAPTRARNRHARKKNSEPLHIQHRNNNDLFVALKANLRGKEIDLFLERRQPICIPQQLLVLVAACFQGNNLVMIKKRILHAVALYWKILNRLTPQVREALLILILKKLAKKDPSLNIYVKEIQLDNEIDDRPEELGLVSVKEDQLINEMVDNPEELGLMIEEEYPHSITVDPNWNFDLNFDFSNLIKEPIIIHFPGNVKAIEPNYELPPSPNNLLPDFLMTEPKPFSVEDVKELPGSASARFEEFPTFFTESQITFKESVIDYLNSESPSALQHFSILNEVRESAIKTLCTAPPKVIVIGGGPSGLVAALEAYLSGSTVYLIEKRKNYSRDTMLRLRMDTAWYLKERLGDHLYTIVETNELIKTRSQGGFEKEFFGPEAFIIIETKILEWLLAMILFSLAKRDDGIKIYREWEFSDLKEGENVTHVTIQDSNSRKFTIPCDFLIGADGARSRVREKSGIDWNVISTARPSLALTFTNLWANNFAYQELHVIPQSITNAFNVLKENDSSRWLEMASRAVILQIRPHIASIEWEETKDQRFQRFIQNRKNGYASELIKVTENEKIIDNVFDVRKEEIVRKEIALAQEGGKILHSELQSLGWKLERLPSNRIFTSTHTIYLGTDIPNELVGAKLKKLTPWISTTLEQNLPKPVIQILLPQIRTCTTFQAQLFQASSVRKGRVFLIGDAVGTPDFQTGSGAKKAMDDGLAIGKLIYQFGHSENYQEDLFQYEQEAEKRTVELHQKSFKWGFSEELK